MPQQTSNLKWAIGVVIIPLGISLATAGFATASYQGSQVAINASFEKEMIRLREETKADVDKILRLIEGLKKTQENIEKRQIEIGVREDIREQNTAQFFLEFRQLRDKVLLLGIEDGRN